jgi:hypothetical protein
MPNEKACPTGIVKLMVRVPKLVEAPLWVAQVLLILGSDNRTGLLPERPKVKTLEFARELSVWGGEYPNARSPWFILADTRTPLERRLMPRTSCAVTVSPDCNACALRIPDLGSRAVNDTAVPNANVFEVST